MVQMEGGLFGVRAGTDSGSLAIFSWSGWKSEALGFGDAIFTIPIFNLSKNKH